MEPQEHAADPAQLRAEAEREPRRRGLDVYLDTIRLLKEQKGFSYREIAAWLHKRGVNTDHNAVWRTYAKAVSTAGMGADMEQNEQTERKQSHLAAMPWMDDRPQDNARDAV